MFPGGRMKTIHLITSAHLDPIWLWPWQNGLDAVLNTCRTMVRFLERHPQVIFTCGEAWKYRQVQELAPSLFEQIRSLIEEGRWEVIGGWWIQPDCNAPSGFAMERQIELGMRYFRDNFGQTPSIGYNVDSFGHAATLPGYLRTAGQSSYVMMRPQENEMALPARLFNWQGYANGPAVTTFRIAGGYGDFNRISEAHIRASLTELPEGIDHTMCFLGVGDHGGGPNERLMAWLEEHRSAFSDVRLVWSSPARFFAAIQNDLHKLPTYTGELQHHAVGCYSVYRPVKTAVRRAEHLLAQAETLATPADRETLDEAWRTLCFHHFHDTLGGTCLPSAYTQVESQLGGVCSFADTLLQTRLRQSVLKLPADPHHRIVLHNASDKSYVGYASWEYWWTDGGKWEPHWRFIDEHGQTLTHQEVTTEAVQIGMQSRFLLRANLAAGETRVIRVDRTNLSEGHEPITSLKAEPDRLENNAASIHFTNDGNETMMLNGMRLPLPKMELIPDPTDTWSHGIERFAEGPVTHCVLHAVVPVECGILTASVVRHGRIGVSPVLAEYRVYANEPFVELVLRIEWVQHGAVLKFTLPVPSGVSERVDGILGGELVRRGDGTERPMRDYTMLRLENGTKIGIVCPDVFALDATPERVRFTLLRNPLMAHHDPAPRENARGRPSDTGLHEFRFRFFAGDNLSTTVLEEHATAWQRPLLVAETTDGMPAT
ncbi:MAG: hypothetical protein QM754_21195 [Tepidisphaeraceae bacterium]